MGATTDEETVQTLQVSKKQALQLSAPSGVLGSGPGGLARSVEQRTSTNISVVHNPTGADVTIRGSKTGVAKATTLLKALVAFKESASPEERGICPWFACGFCREHREDEDGCEAGLHSAEIILQVQADWLSKTPKPSIEGEMPKVKSRPLLLTVSCGGAAPPPLAGSAPGPRPATGGGIGCFEEELIELCIVAVDWEKAEEVSRFHRFIRPGEWDEKDAEMRQAFPPSCFAPTKALAFSDVLADLMDWLPNLLGVTLDEVMPEDFLWVSPRDWEIQNLLPRRCAYAGVDSGLQDFFLRRWCCLKDVFRQHFALPNEAAPNGLSAMARYLGQAPSDKAKRTFCMDENAIVVRVTLELARKGWKPTATAWRASVMAPTTFLLPRRGDVPAPEAERSGKRNFSQMEADPFSAGPPPSRPPQGPPGSSTGVIGATAKAAAKAKVVVPPWQLPQPLPKGPSMPFEAVD